MGKYHVDQFHDEQFMVQLKPLKNAESSSYKFKLIYIAEDWWWLTCGPDSQPWIPLWHLWIFWSCLWIAIVPPLISSPHFHQQNISTINGNQRYGQVTRILNSDVHNRFPMFTYWGNTIWISVIGGLETAGITLSICTSFFSDSALANLGHLFAPKNLTGCMNIFNEQGQWSNLYWASTILTFAIKARSLSNPIKICVEGAHGI